MPSATPRKSPTWAEAGDLESQTTNRVDTTWLKKEMPDIAAQFTTSSESRVFRLTKSKE